ncbi:hypothetical protein ACH5A2_19785 [Streptomyces collinus]|uniref:hypothetical protein n=1 Tax=Streptomyces collinus TaxID=42684 RepID=UPI0037AD4487
MSDDYDDREEICPDCQATEGDRDARIMTAGEDPKTGRMFTSVTYHHDTCPAYTVNQILTEDSVRRSKERTAWMKQEFPLVRERLEAAARGGQGDAGPFVAALLELVAAQGEDLGRFVPPEKWTEILTKYFPPDGVHPARPNEGPSA